MSVLRETDPTGDEAISETSLLLYTGESRSGVEATEWLGVDLDVDGMANGIGPYFLGEILSVDGGIT